MNLKHLVIAAAALLPAVAANAQKADISPVPQKVEWGSKAFDSAGRTYAVKGKADEATAALLKKHFGDAKKGDVKIIVGKAGDKDVKSVAKLIPQQAEGYYLSVEPGKIIVAGRDDAGTYYGLQSLLQILEQPEVMSVKVTDWPMTEVRGVIEGFYGNPWSYDDRVSQFDFYGANKMNIYIYGPKDDPYHHSRWQEPYPEAEAAKMKQLVKHAADNKVKFVWAMHPSNSIVSAEDKSKALEKLNQMYDMGIRAFAIFFDDISAKSVDSQVEYLNFLTDEFVNKKGDVEQMIVCPTQYNRLWAGGDYLSKMGAGLYPGIKIMWTGNSVVDMIQKPDCDWFKEQTGRAPFIWLNYPVNDYGMHNMLMGPFVDNGTDIYDQVTAFCSNPMQYAEASKVALYSIADYAWNPKDYNSDNAWERSITYLMPEHADAFRTFCLSNVDVGPSVHKLRLLGETPDFKELIDKYPSITPQAAAEYTAYFAKNKAAAQELLGLLGKSPMVDELKEFIEYYDLQSDRGRYVIEMATALNGKNNDAFLKAYKGYKDATDAAGKLMSRGFEGSIQSVPPRTATLYVEPFIRANSMRMVNEYKASGAEYPAGLFPEQVLDNGLYYIKVDGKYLTNVKGSDAPVFVESIDEINPGRQLWIITFEATSGRYNIKSEWDKRFVNEIGSFGNNNYDENWNTYQITREGDKYAIRNAGFAGNNYWKLGKERLTKGSSKEGAENYFIEIVPSAQNK